MIVSHVEHWRTGVCLQLGKVRVAEAFSSIAFRSQDGIALRGGEIQYTLLGGVGRSIVTRAVEILNSALVTPPTFLGLFLISSRSSCVGLAFVRGYRA